MFRFVIFSSLFLATFAASTNRANPTEGRIVGGQNTDITDVPHQVTVQHKGKIKCGGSIIGPRHILTAAHCIEGKDPKLLSIRAGSNYHHKEGQVVNAESFIIHPNYDNNNANNDAAVIFLQQPLRLGSGVRIANLATVEPKERDMVLISGWGSMKKGTKIAASFLQSVSIPVVSRAVCQQKYPKEQITEEMFCAGHPKGGKDSCDGDSGGPAIVKGKLAGIVSWGEGCGDERYPGVYTNIPKMVDWITTQIRK